MQRGVAAIPKSVRKVRMEENSDIDDFSLSSDDMANIAALSLTREQILNLRCPWEVKRLYGIKCND